MNLRFDLRLDKADRVGRAPVYLFLFFDGHRLQVFTKEKCQPAEWNAERQQFRKSFTGQQEANSYLEQLAEKARKAYRELLAAGVAPTPAMMREALRPRSAEPEPEPEAPTPVVPFTELYEEYRQALRARGYSHETLRQRLVVRNWLRDFERDKSETLTPETYDVATHDRLLAYLRFDRKLAENTVATLVRNVRVFLRYLREERGFTVPVELRKLQGRALDVVKMWLSAADLVALTDAKLPATLMPVRDVLLFCCYTGLRYSDVCALQKGNVEEWNGSRVLRLVQTKTRASVSIYLTQVACAIIDKYAQGAERLRLLPTTANQVMNRYLKRIGEAAGLTQPVVLAERVAGVMVKKSVPKFELLTMHTARHTFATQSLLRGMPVEVLQKVMGHKRIQTTLVYAKVVEDLQHQTMRRVWEGDASPVPGTAATPGVCEVKMAA